MINPKFEKGAQEAKKASKADNLVAADWCEQ
jgi:hypothetical protein